MFWYIIESQEIADEAARLVQVTYNSVKPPVLTIDDAIAAKTFCNKPMPDIIIGTPDRMLKSSKN